MKSQRLGETNLAEAAEQRFQWVLSAPRARALAGHTASHLDAVKPGDCQNAAIPWEKGLRGSGWFVPKTTRCGPSSWEPAVHLTVRWSHRIRQSLACCGRVRCVLEGWPLPRRDSSIKGSAIPFRHLSNQGQSDFCCKRIHAEQGETHKNLSPHSASEQPAFPHSVRLSPGLVPLPVGAPDASRPEKSFPPPAPPE